MTKSNYVVTREGCWEWSRGRDKDGYGIFSVAKGMPCRLPRLVFRIFNGKLKPSEVVRHTCDNPPCINPLHLMKGSHSDNRQDALRRGRANVAFGDAKSQTKISNADCHVIRDVYAEGVLTMKMLSDLYGVAESTIHRIVSGTRKIVPVEDEE